MAISMHPDDEELALHAEDLKLGLLEDTNLRTLSRAVE
jgi:hypothetical protein